MASTEFATRSHKGAAFLFLLGLALVGAGAGFAFAPHYSWRVAQFANKVGALGLSNGALFVGGLVTLGLAIVARVAGAQPAVHDSSADTEALQSELRILNEQMSTKLAQLRTSMLQVNEGVAAIATQQQVQLQGQSQKPEAGDHAQDAMFRLAASLDKLHAHFDERVHAVDLQLRSGFEALLQASQDVRRVLGQAGVDPEVAPSPAPRAHSGPAPLTLQESGNASGIDFYETMQKLDAIVGGDDSQPSDQPQAPFPRPGHGQSFDSLLPEEYRDRY